jgi:hypothetical protein
MSDAYRLPESRPILQTNIVLEYQSDVVGSHTAYATIASGSRIYNGYPAFAMYRTKAIIMRKTTKLRSMRWRPRLIPWAIRTS